jgi:hypothetical protein
MEGRRADQTLHDAWADEPAGGNLVLGRGIWRPAAGYGRLVGHLFIAGLVLIALLSLLLTIQDDSRARVVWVLLMVGALAAAFRVWIMLRGLASIRYILGEDQLIIEHQRTTRRIPYDDILDITYQLRDRFDLPQREPYWPGYRVSTIRTREGTWHSWATVAPHRRVRITTAAAVFAISPERPVLFIQELERRRSGGVLVQQSGITGPVVETGAPGALPRRRRSDALAPINQSISLYRNLLLTDRIASTLVAVGVIIPVLLLAYTFNEVDFLPERIPLRWNADGQVVETGPGSAIWMLPLLAIAVLVINAALATLVIRFDRVAARLLVAITPMVQFATAIALWRIIGR